MAGSFFARLIPSLSPGMVSLERLGFEPCEPSTRRSLEGALGAFVGGFNRARRIRDDEALAENLRRSFDSHHVGFAYEGAGGQRAMLDLLLPWHRGRFKEFTSGAAADHDYIAAVGAGLILARFPRGASLVGPFMRRLDPLLAWCIPDGYGFSCGLARHGQWIDRRQPPPSSFPPFAARLFDAGLGRSLWWLKGASPTKIRSAIERFPETRQSHLWFGVGLACAYAGGLSAAQLRRLRTVAGAGAVDLLAGVPFACWLRQKGGNPSPSTDLASRELLGTDADSAASRLRALFEETLAEESRNEEELRSRTFDQLRLRLVEYISSGDSSVARVRVRELNQAVSRNRSQVRA